MPTTELIFIRHGESTGNAAAAAANRAEAEVITIDRRDADVPLSELGVRQAEALGRGLRPLLGEAVPIQVWSSPYVRAVQTAQTALSVAGSELPILVDERLRDRELGILDLLTWRGVERRHPQEAERRRWLGKFYHRPPGGESWADVALRLRSFLRDLTDRAEGARTVVICHDALVMLFRYICEGLTEAQVLQIATTDPVRNVSVTAFRLSELGQWQLTRYNDVAHLEESDVPVTEHRGEVDAPVRP